MVIIFVPDYQKLFPHMDFNRSCLWNLILNYGLFENVDEIVYILLRQFREINSSICA